MIESAFLQFLAAQVPSFDSGLGAETINYFFQAAPQTETAPYAVFNLTGEDQDYPKNLEGTVYAYFDLEVYHTNEVAAAQIADALKTALNGYVGVMFGYRVTLMRVQNGFDDQEGETNLFYRNLSVQINYKRL